MVVAALRRGWTVVRRERPACCLGVVHGSGVSQLDGADRDSGHLMAVLMAVLGATCIAFSGILVSLILLSQPVAAVLLAALLIGETPSVFQVAGVGLVLTGVAVGTIPVRFRREVASSS